MACGSVVGFGVVVRMSASSPGPAGPRAAAGADRRRGPFGVKKGKKAGTDEGAGEPAPFLTADLAGRAHRAHAIK